MINAIPEFLWLALTGGVCVALAAGPLGAFVVWRKMAYFGDTLAHGALLGVTVGFALSASIPVSLLVVCIGLALALALLENLREHGTDTLLGILSHSALAAGLVGLSLLNDVRVDLMAFLFGDLLTITPRDIVFFLVIDFIVLGSLAFFWPTLLLATIDENLAKAEGVAVNAIRILMLVLVALVVAVAIRAVGVLLITALLIIPAAAARPLSRNPESMALLAALWGALAVLLGLASSYCWDIPAGPAIVLSATALFICTHSFSFLRR